SKVVVCVNAPQSPTTRLSSPASDVEPEVVDSATLNTPATEPVFVMSTVPLVESPGFMFDAVRMDAAELLLLMDRVPVAKVLLGFADDAVKSAPEPTARAAAASSRPSAPSVRQGLLINTERRDIQ